MGGEVDHEISPSEGGAFVAVMGAARLANAESVEPSPSDTNSDATAQSEPEVTGLAPRATYSPDPHPSQADGGQPQTSNEAGAKNDGLQAIVGRAPTGEAEDGQFEEQQASAAQDRNKPVSASGAAATLSEPFEPPAFLRKTITDYRPLCQRPEACWSSGLKHCHSCQKIADAAESEAA